MNYEKTIAILEQHGITPDQCMYCCRDIPEDATDCPRCNTDANTFHNSIGVSTYYKVATIRDFLGY